VGRQRRPRDFGLSIGQGRPVSDEILERVPATLLLGGLSYLVAECIAIPLGIFAALRRYSFFDTLFTVLSYIGLSMPSFWLSGILILIFAVWPAGCLPAHRRDTANIPTFNGVGYWAYFGGHPWHAGVDLLRTWCYPLLSWPSSRLQTTAASCAPACSRSLIRTTSGRRARRA